MTIASMTACSRLASIVGSAHVLSDSQNLRVYEISGEKPAAVVSPGTSEEVAEVVKFAALEKLAIVPAGACTKLAMGMPPQRYDLAIDMTRLDRVAAYDPADLTLGVEPGIPLQRLAGVLNEHKQWLPLGAPYMSRATIGGTIASGVDGAFRQMYGTARDYVLGMEFVTGEGVPAKSGGRVVKNVTGYDLHKLMVGALGTLGVITKINFRTFPVPVGTRCLAANFESAERALELRHRIAHSPLTPLTMELLSPGAAKLLGSDVAARIVPEPIPPNLFSTACWAVIAGFSGNEKVLDRCERDFRQSAEACGSVNFAALGMGEFAGVAGRTREFVPIALESTPATTLAKISVLPMRMAEALGSAAKAAETNSLQWAAAARGLGVIYVALLAGDRTEETRRRAIQATNQIQHECAGLGGNATVPWCPADWKSELKIWGLDRGDLDQMRKVKNLFDPQSILSPGRFVGGI